MAKIPPKIVIHQGVRAGKVSASNKPVKAAEASPMGEVERPIHFKVNHSVARQASIQLVICKTANQPKIYTLTNAAGIKAQITDII